MPYELYWDECLDLHSFFSKQNSGYERKMFHHNRLASSFVLVEVVHIKYAVAFENIFYCILMNIGK